MPFTRSERCGHAGLVQNGGEIPLDVAKTVDMTGSTL
jgi:hypothetical protein